jgi:hypothetical protein
MMAAELSECTLFSYAWLDGAGLDSTCTWRAGFCDIDRQRAAIIIYENLKIFVSGSMVRPVRRESMNAYNKELKNVVRTLRHSFVPDYSFAG